jgi:hypothetical protein
VRLYTRSIPHYNLCQYCMVMKYSCHCLAENGEETHGGEAARNQSRTAPPNARAGCRRRRVATKGCERLLPLPCGPGEHRPVECLRATLAAIVAAHSTPSQSTTNVVEPDNPDLQAVDSSPTRFASLSYSSFPRHSSKVGAVCVEAPGTGSAEPWAQRQLGAARQMARISGGKSHVGFLLRATMISNLMVSLPNGHQRI